MGTTAAVARALHRRGLGDDLVVRLADAAAKDKATALADDDATHFRSNSAAAAATSESQARAERLMSLRELALFLALFRGKEEEF